MIRQSSDDVHTAHQSDAIQSLDALVGSRNRSNVLRRIRWIEDRLWWTGSLRRSDLVDRFGISPQQASQDIAAYQHIHPGLAKMDPSSRAYLLEEGATPLFPKDPPGWISQEMADGAPVLPLERLPMPGRRATPRVMAGLLAAFDARRAVTIEYQSMSRDGPSARTICPHHLIDTGHRSHVRAWDALRGRFADFVVGRIVSASPCPEYPWVDGLADEQWHNLATVVLAPASGLTTAQRRAVEEDYGMHGGRVEFTVRKALVTYVAEALGVLEEIQSAVGAEPPTRGRRELCCLNPRELAAYVPS